MADPKISSSRPPPPNMPVIGHVGKYELLGRLAYGGMAEIFLAREVSAATSRYLVIKRILPHVAHDQAFVQMFLDEARIVMRLAHPNVCHIYDFGRTTQDGAETYYIAMEWISGVSLGKLIRRARADGGIPTPIAVRIISEVAEALHYAHRAKDELGKPLGIVHRDVSPENVMVSFEGGVKLLDFGIAKQTTKQSSTQAGVVKGKFAYMSPEQCRALDLDLRSDVFALGICMFEALTGKPLYHRKADLETMMAIVKEPVPSARAVSPEIPEALDNILRKALAKQPERRWQTAGQLHEALETYLAQGREVVTASRIADYLGARFSDDSERIGIADSTPFGSSYVDDPEIANARIEAEQKEWEAWTSSAGASLSSLDAEATEREAVASVELDEPQGEQGEARDEEDEEDEEDDEDEEDEEDDDAPARSSVDQRDVEILKLRQRERALVAALVDAPEQKSRKWPWIVLAVLVLAGSAAAGLYFLAPAQFQALFGQAGH